MAIQCASLAVAMVLDDRYGRCSDGNSAVCERGRERLRISVYTLRYLRQEGRFAPAVKIGRRLFWEEKDLDSWLIDQKEPA
jgi:hypothetical protein